MVNNIAEHLGLHSGIHGLDCTSAFTRDVEAERKQNHCLNCGKSVMHLSSDPVNSKSDFTTWTSPVFTVIL